jgi:hypothetical protein
MKPRLGLLDAFDWLAGQYLERTERATRELPPILYLSLGLLALLQVLNPGAIERIASQTAGRWLLAALTGLLILATVFAVADLALNRTRTVLGPGALDALLHFSLAAVGLKLSFGPDLVPEPAGTLVIGALGLACAGAGAFSLLTALLRLRAEPDGSSLRSGLVLRDHLVRGGVPLVLGALLFASSVQGLAVHGLDPTRQLWAVPLLAVATLALFAYGLHSIWSMRQEARIAMF